MKFFVIDNNGDKIYVTFAYPVERKSDIPYEFTVFCETCNEEKYFYRQDVRAETGTDSVIGGALVGGALGLTVGPQGALLGAILGGLLGANTDAEEQRKLHRFNEG